MSHTPTRKLRYENWLYFPKPVSIPTHGVTLQNIWGPDHYSFHSTLHTEVCISLVCLAHTGKILLAVTHHTGLHYTQTSILWFGFNLTLHWGDAEHQIICHYSLWFKSTHTGVTEEQKYNKVV